MGESGLQLIRKVERGGTTGFRAPEVLWHSRDQVGYDMKGVMIQCFVWWYSKIVLGTDDCLYYRVTIFPVIVLAV